MRCKAAHLHASKPVCLIRSELVEELLPALLLDSCKLMQREPLKGRLIKRGISPYIQITI